MPRFLFFAHAALTAKRGEPFFLPRFRFWRLSPRGSKPRRATFLWLRFLFLAHAAGTGVFGAGSIADGGDAPAHEGAVDGVRNSIGRMDNRIVAIESREMDVSLPGSGDVSDWAWGDERGDDGRRVRRSGGVGPRSVLRSRARALASSLQCAIFALCPS